MNSISPLQFITGDARLAEKALQCGVDWIQLRLKNIREEIFREKALEVRELCRYNHAKLIINDNVPLAFDIGADGVHLGKEDVSPEKARKFLGSDAVIGCTANTYEDIIRLSQYKVDYIGLGPFRFTTTKSELSPILGIEGYKTIFKSLQTHQDVFPSPYFYSPVPPIIAIGGITPSDVKDLLETGVFGVAVSGSIANAESMEKTINKFRILLTTSISAL